MDNTNYTASGFSQWSKNASPEDLLTVNKAIVARLETLDHGTQERFVKAYKSSPVIGRLIEKQTA